MDIRIPANDERARARIPVLTEWLRRICGEISDRLEVENWNQRGDFAFLGICFLSKQISHGEALLRLIPHKDTTLIARTMVEGLIQFLWALQEPDERAHDWRAYAVLEDYASIPIRTAMGDPPTKEMLASIEATMDEFGPRFFTKKARSAIAAGKDLPKNPYHNNWRRGVSIKQAFERVQGDDLWAFFYGPCSAWAHWSSIAFADRLSSPEPNHTIWTPVADSMAAQSIVVAIMCILQTAGLVFDHIGHPDVELPGALRNEFVDWQATEFKELVDPKT